MDCLLILTPVLHDLEDFVCTGLVCSRILSYGAPDFLFLEPVAAPVVFPSIAYRGVPADGGSLVAGGEEGTFGEILDGVGAWQLEHGVEPLSDEEAMKLAVQEQHAHRRGK
jgi:hypothetical protein